MVNLENDNEKNQFDRLIVESVAAIKKDNIDQAVGLIKLAASISLERPETYNLLGIIYEQQGDNFNACKYYRVAYYIDQTFKAANDNLERVSNLFYHGFLNVNFGLDRCGGI